MQKRFVDVSTDAEEKQEKQFSVWLRGEGIPFVDDDASAAYRERASLIKDAIHIKSESLDFKTAKQIATQKARELCSDPMLLAWYQGKTGEYTPKTECGAGDKPAWIVYAQSRGGDITIDINDEEYIFIFKSNPK